MSDVLNCDGMTAEQARAALRAHCRAQEAARKAERDKRAEHRRANAERLGWVVGHPPARPKKFPVRVGQRPEIRFNGRRALVARWQDAFIGFDSGHPVKRLTFEIVAGRYDCFRVTAILEDEDLTPETYWLSGCDVSEVTGGAIRFCSGFELAARDGAAAFAVQAIPEPEVAASRHLLKAAAALESGGGAAPANSKPKTKQRQAVTQRDAAKLCGVTAKTVQRWEKGESTPEGYPGRGDAVALGAWVARRKEAAYMKRGLAKMMIVPDMDRATQKKQYSDWQAEMRRRGVTGYRSSDY